MFTRDQIEEIKKKLVAFGTKDTQLLDAHKLDGNEIVAIVQDGENRKIPLSSIIGLLSDISVTPNDDFINISKDTTGILTLDTAVSKVDINNRKLGQVITFKDSTNSWAIRQFTGSSLDNWRDTSLWKNIAGIDELKSQADTNTSNISSLNTEVSTLQSKVDVNTTSISQINNTIAGHEESIAQINTKLSEHTSNISNLGSAIEKNTSDIKNVSDTVDAQAARLDDVDTTLDNALFKNKGYFTTLEKLNEAVPNPTIGSKAYVGTSEPYAIYIVENGVWVDSGYTGGDEIVAKITTDRIEDGAVTIGKLEPSIQSLITNISKNASFAGIATPTTNPGIPDAPVFYIAAQTGTYSNFNNNELTDEEVAVFLFDGSWKKYNTGIAKQEFATASYNLYLATFFTNKTTTRLSVPSARRKNGLIIAYKLDGRNVLEQFYSESGATNDASWCEDSSWKSLVFNEDMVEYIDNLAGVRINLKAGNNLFNEDNVQLNKALRNTSTGLKLQDFSGYNSSQFISVKPNTDYTISCGSGNIYTLGEFSLDRIESNVKFTTIGSNDDYTFTTSERTKYILVSVTSATINLMINEGNSALPYEKYKLSLYTDTYGNIITIMKDNIPNSIISKDKLNNEVIEQLDKAGELILNKSKNLFNEDTVQKDSALRGATNISSNFTNYVTSQFIEVKANTQYTISVDSRSGNIYSMCQYSNNELNDYVAGTFVTINNKNDYTFTTSQETRYILVCIYSPVAPMLNEGGTALPYESYNRDTEIESDAQGRKVTLGNEDSSFTVKYSENLIIPEIFTEKGWFKNNSLTATEDYCYANQKIPIKGGVTYIAKARYIGINWYDRDETYISFNGYSEVDGQLIKAPANAVWALITLSYNNFRKGTDCIFNEGEILSEEKKGTFPVIDEYKDGYPLKANVSEEDKFLFKKSYLLGKKYASLGDSISNRDQWQEVLDFYTGMTHVNFAVGGISMGKFPFKYGTSGSENTGDIDAATAIGLISSADLEGCNYIIICGYANNAGGNGTALGTIDDEFIIISEEDAQKASSYNDYANSIKSQSFHAQCKSTIEYIQKIAPNARIIGAGQLKMSVPMYNEKGELDSSVNFRRKNKQGHCVSDYSNAMEEVFNYFGLPFVNMDKNGGINEFNQETVYPKSDKVHCNFVEFRGGTDYPFSGMKRMAELIYSKLAHLG